MNYPLTFQEDCAGYAFHLAPAPHMTECPKFHNPPPSLQRVTVSSYSSCLHMVAPTNEPTVKCATTTKQQTIRFGRKCSYGQRYAFNVRPTSLQGLQGYGSVL